MNDEELDALEDWLAHPVTQSQARALRKESDGRLLALISAAKTSNDARVASAVADYLATERLAAFLEGKGRRNG